MLKIGDFSKLTHVTVKALRLYDEMNLLKPTWVDRYTSYRYYSLEQLPRLNRILALKDLGFPLEQVRTLLDESVSAEQLRSMMRLRQADLTRQIQQEQQRLARVETRLKEIEIEGKHPVYEVVIKQGQPQMLASLRQRVPSFEQLSSACEQMLAELLVWQQSVHLQGDPLWMKIIHNPSYTEQNIDLEVALLLRTTVQPRVSGRVHLHTIPAVRHLASAICRGEDEGEIQSVYNALYNWTSSNGWRIQGASRELHLVAPQSTLPFIEVQIPIEPILGTSDSLEEIMLEPTFIQKPAFLVGGTLYHGKNQHAEIPKMWENDFLPRMHTIKRIDDQVSYGVCSDFDPQTLEFNYMAGVEVESAEALPEGMTLWEVPEGFYAVFEHRGPLKNLMATNEYIYNVWLPKSGYKRLNAPDLEVYKCPEFTGGDDPDSILYIYVPVGK